MKVSLIFVFWSINLFNIFLIYIFCQLPNRYNLDGGRFISKIIIIEKTIPEEIYNRSDE